MWLLFSFLFECRAVHKVAVVKTFPAGKRKELKVCMTIGVYERRNLKENALERQSGVVVRL